MITILSSLPDKFSTVVDLILDIAHPGVDDNIAKNFRTQFFISYRTISSKSVFFRGLYNVSQWSALL